MDESEENLDDRLGVRLVDREGKAQTDSEGETEKEVSAMFEGYNVGLTDREDDNSPPKLELASEFKRNRISPPHTMDIYTLQCPLRACASDGAGCDDIYLRPSKAGIARDGRS